MKLLLRLFSWIALFVRGMSGFEDTFVRPALNATKELRDLLLKDAFKTTVKKTKNKVDDKIYSASLAILTKAISLLQGMEAETDQRTNNEILHDFGLYLQGLPRTVQDAVLFKLASTTVRLTANADGHEVSEHFADAVTQITYTHDKHKASIQA